MWGEASVVAMATPASLGLPQRRRSGASYFSAGCHYAGSHYSEAHAAKGTAICQWNGGLLFLIDNWKRFHDLILFLYIIWLVILWKYNSNETY